MILSKEDYAKLIRELEYRTSNLMQGLKSRELTSDREGAGKGRWTNPEKMCAITASKIEIKLLVADFKSILSLIDTLGK